MTRRGRVATPTARRTRRPRTHASRPPEHRPSSPDLDEDDDFDDLDEDDDFDDFEDDDFEDDDFEDLDDDDDY